MVTAKNLFLTYLGAATVATVAIGNVNPTIAAMETNTAPKVMFSALQALLGLAR